MNDRAQPSAQSSGHAIITGGSSGIGLEIAKQLAGKGFSVSILARDRDRLAVAKSIIEKSCAQGAAVACHSVDVRDSAACLNGVEQCVKQFGVPNWAVSSAGIVEPGDILGLPVEIYEQLMSTNYFGSLYFAHAIAPIMRDAGGGRLVFIASGAALIGLHGYSAYAASKFAVRGLAESLRIELKPAGISVTLAYPPDTETPQFAEEAPKRSEATNKIVGKGGQRKPADIATLIVEAAQRKRFSVAPGFVLGALNPLHSILAPVARSYQDRVVADTNRSKSKK